MTENSISAHGVQKTRMMELPEGQKSSKIGLPFIHNTAVRQTDGQIPHDGKDRALQSVARVRTGIRVIARLKAITNCDSQSLTLAEVWRNKTSSCLKFITLASCTCRLLPSTFHT